MKNANNCNSDSIDLIHHQCMSLMSETNKQGAWHIM